MTFRGANFGFSNRRLAVSLKEAANDRRQQSGFSGFTFSMISLAGHLQDLNLWRIP